MQQQCWEDVEGKLLKPLIFLNLSYYFSTLFPFCFLPFVSVLRRMKNELLLTLARISP